MNDAFEVRYPDGERQIHESLREYTAMRRKHAPSRTSQTATDFVTLLLKKRLFSSPKAFLETLREHMKTLRRRGAAGAVSEARLRAEFDRLEEEVDTDDAVDDRTKDALTTAARAVEPLSKSGIQEVARAESSALRRGSRTGASREGDIEEQGRDEGQEGAKGVTASGRYVNADGRAQSCRPPPRATS
jgi:hypothetical protein